VAGGKGTYDNLVLNLFEERKKAVDFDLGVVRAIRVFIGVESLSDFNQHVVLEVFVEGVYGLGVHIANHIHRGQIHVLNRLHHVRQLTLGRLKHAKDVAKVFASDDCHVSIFGLDWAE
jgi:histidyl-tRNA synthetase